MARRADYSEKVIGLGLEFDYKQIERTLDDIEKKVLPYAAAKVLNNAAFGVRRALIVYTDKIFDRPNAFTRGAWLVDKAQSKDGPNMSAAIKARPKQAEYLQHQIFGGTRKKGSAGSGPYDLFAYSAKLTKFGGVDRGYLKKIASQAKAERKDRKVLAAKRKAALKNEDMTPKERRSLQWNVASKNKPGIFFGEIYGLKGYWRRSERYTPRARSKIGSPVWTKAGSTPQLLFGVKSTIKNKPIFNYDKVVAESFAKHANEKEFRAILDQRAKALR